MKRSGLKANKPLKRTGYLRRTGRLAAVSEKRKNGMDDREEVRAAVLARDGGCLLHLSRALNDGSWGPCMGGLTFHHLKKASAGGAYNEENGATLCVHHNRMVEDRPDDATRLGLVIRGKAVGERSNHG